MTTIAYEPKFAMSVRPDRLTDGKACWVATHPGLDGVFGTGATELDAMLDLDAAREAYFRSLKRRKKPLPRMQKSSTTAILERTDLIVTSEYGIHFLASEATTTTSAQ